MDERRGHPGQQILEGQALAQGVEGVAAILGVSEHHRPVADRVERGAGVHEQEHLAPAVGLLTHEEAGADVMVAVTPVEPSEHVVGVVGVQELDQLATEQLLLIEPQQGMDGRADVPDGAVGGHGEDHVADLGQRLVELDPSDQRPEICVVDRLPLASARGPPRGRARGREVGGGLRHGLVPPVR